MDEAKIKVKGLSFSYKEKAPLFTDLSFELFKGEALCVLGSNGCGKSTLLDILAGLKEPLQGSVTIDGESSIKIVHKLRLLPQNIDYFLLGQSVGEELELSLKDDQTEVESLAEAWGLTGMLDEYVDTLSGGEKKRLALIGALASDPLVLFLDEPFSGLDWNGTKTLINDLKTLKQRGETLVLVSHDPSVLLDVCECFLLMSKDKGYVFTRDLSELKNNLEKYGVRPIE
jgi:NitT/TauT family transport system ATP-binding protein